ncbi:hypothetical protein DJ66_1147 [Candidatus Liberibacter solanacearum]|uniref:Uncharacterized protein n=1 Tax=Candidatus Liberibacter solanacearum TaxID=556287 RepID=A0A0F4VM96_9HYPH|nr:hypothetical protein DJ66_1147 [Candidatus Liberibacter solanacearum]
MYTEKISILILSSLHTIGNIYMDILLLDVTHNSLRTFNSFAFLW